MELKHTNNGVSVRTMFRPDITYPTKGNLQMCQILIPKLHMIYPGCDRCDKHKIEPLGFDHDDKNIGIYLVDSTIFVCTCYFMQDSASFDESNHSMMNEEYFICKCCETKVYNPSTPKPDYLMGCDRCHMKKVKPVPDWINFEFYLDVKSNMNDDIQHLKMTPGWLLHSGTEINKLIDSYYSYYTYLKDSMEISFSKGRWRNDLSGNIIQMSITCLNRGSVELPQICPIEHGILNNGFNPYNNSLIVKTPFVHDIGQQILYFKNLTYDYNREAVMKPMKIFRKKRRMVKQMCVSMC